MRLTLRALLAHLYLHNLNPAEAEELRKKIEENEFASSLVHRIRSSTRRLRLGVPALDGRGIGLDPNTVAEYLEDALPTERVADLEKVCLESDVHLAEVAACYEILAIVLSEPAVVSPELRDRILELGGARPHRPAEPAAAADGPPRTEAPVAPPTGTVPVTAAVGDQAPTAVAAPPESSAVSRKTQVPEYLRAGQRPAWMPLAIALAIAFLVVMLILRAFGEFNRSHPLMRLLGEAPAELAQSPAPTKEPADAEKSGPQPAPADDQTRTAPPIQEPPAEPRMATAPKTPAPPADADDVAGQGPEKPSLPNAVGKPEAEPPRPAEPPTGPVETKVGPGPAAPAGPPPGELPAGAEMGKPKPPPPAGPTAPTVPGAIVGYVKDLDTQVLTRLDPQTETWNRLAGRTQLAAGDQLFILPTYRPEIVLTPGVQVTFVGPSRVTLLPPTPPGEPGLAVLLGRALISTAGVPGAKIHLVFGSQHAIATFLDATAEMAIDIYPYLAPGSHPERDVAETIAHIYCTVGRVEWRDRAEDPPVPIDAGQRRMLVGNRAQTIAVREPPPWIRREDLTALDRLGSTALQPSLSVDRPLALALKERTEDRRSEVRSLAARGLAYLGTYDAVLKELADDRQRVHWPLVYDALRDALSLGSAQAAQVRIAVENICGNDGQAVYRLLEEYSPQQLQEGGDKLLVEQLNHPSLAVRVLAFENLRRITNKTHNYRPEYPETRRKTGLQEWRQELQKGGIIYDTLPSGVPLGR